MFNLISTILKKLAKNNFSWVFVASSFGILFGFVYRLVLAYLFGTSDELKNYLYLSTGMSFFIQFAGQTALQGNLVPYFTNEIRKKSNYSLTLLIRDSTTFSTLFFTLNIILSVLIMIYTEMPFNSVNILLILLLSIALFVYFFNSVGLMLIQAIGDYKSFSYAMIYNSLVRGLFIFPIGYIFGIIGIVLSQIISFIVLYFGGWGKVSKKEINASPEFIRLKFNNFNFGVLVLSNYYSFYILFATLIFTININSEITNFSYAIALLGILINSLGKTINTFLIRETTVAFNMNRMLKYNGVMFIFSIFFLSFIWMFGLDLVKLIFQRGMFDANDTLKTYEYIKNLIIPFILLSFSGAFIQGILSAGDSIKNTFTKIVITNTMLSFIIIVILGKLAYINIMQSIQLFFYENSLILLFGSIYFIMKRHKTFRKNIINQSSQ